MMHNFTFRSDSLTPSKIRFVERNPTINRVNNEGDSLFLPYSYRVRKTKRAAISIRVGFAAIRSVDPSIPLIKRGGQNVSSPLPRGSERGSSGRKLTSMFKQSCSSIKAIRLRFNTE